MTNYYRFKIDKMPDCKSCKKEMDYWTFGQKEYEHEDCASERILNEMISKVKKDLSKKF